MGNPILKKSAILTICLLCTAVIIDRKSLSVTMDKPRPLNDALESIDGWSSSPPIRLDPAIVEALALDDYLNRYYSQGDDRVFLYIGYYYTSKKVGAAHDPMVCFPGQGWHLTQKETGALTMDRNPEMRVEYASMIAELGDRKELILYWFQAMDTTSSNTFFQKLALLKKKLLNQTGDNAFVRISMPLEPDSVADTKKTALQFIQNFYPEFASYVMEGE